MLIVCSGVAWLQAGMSFPVWLCIVLRLISLYRYCTVNGNYSRVSLQVLVWFPYNTVSPLLYLRRCSCALLRGRYSCNIQHWSRNWRTCGLLARLPYLHDLCVHHRCGSCRDLLSSSGCWLNLFVCTGLDGNAGQRTNV